MIGLIITIALCVILPVAIIFIIHYYKNKERTLRYQLYQSALEKGVQLPDNIFNEPKVKPARNGYRLMTWGVVILSFGIGSFFVIYFSADANDFPRQFSMSSAPIILLGIGLLVSFLLQRRLSKKDKEQA